MRAWQHHQAISPASRRIRQKVRGRAKAEVREKLQALHRELKACMGDYLDDGPATRQARTAGNGRRLAGYAIGEPGAVKLKGLTAGQVHKALAEVPVSRPARSLCSGPG
jgi:hypothetical protein